eukprot:m.754298 g.754298  ORF g.754298 m.754298 type:complete len:105 (-) comp23175_c0_seq25:128-442(-)
MHGGLCVAEFCPLGSLPVPVQLFSEMVAVGLWQQQMKMSHVSWAVEGIVASIDPRTHFFRKHAQQNAWYAQTLHINAVTVPSFLWLNAVVDDSMMFDGQCQLDV